MHRGSKHSKCTDNIPSFNLSDQEKDKSIYKDLG
ncbi:hypothetical protein CAL7102_03416 [Dulcicalothrix desertica PCC 7102]|nr:hypothetical protein CAL7102_03416 [Dulcicalothrix desertica PCC 7102]